MGRIDKAFQAIDRAHFLTPEGRGFKHIDAPLLIGHGQTNSQPTVVRWMLEWLDPQPGEKILDVGSGSGWTTSLLAHLVLPDGVVHGVEKVPELVDFGAQNSRRAGIENVHFFEASDQLGLPEYAPYDRILVSAAAQELPQELLDQLKVGGKAVLPVKNSIWVVNKVSNKKYKMAEHPGFVFVPLI